MHSWTLARSLGVVALLLPLVVLPGVPQQGYTLRFALLSLAVPYLLLMFPSTKMKPHVWLLVALLGYAALTITWGTNLTEGLQGWWKLFLLCGCIHLGSKLSTGDHKGIYKMFAYGMLASVLVVAPLQMMGYLSPGNPWVGANVTYPEPSGLWVNARLFGEASALAALGTVSTPWLFLASVIGVFISNSRNAMVALVVALTIGTYIRWRVVHLAVLVFLVGSLLAYLCGHQWVAPAGVDALEYVTSARWSVWKDIVANLTLWGHGIGQFFVDFAGVTTAGPNFRFSRAEYAHNEPLHYMFELGAPGLLLFTGIFAYAILHRGAWLKATPQLLIVLATLVEILFAFPLHMPGTLFLSGLALGGLIGLRHGVVSDEHLCGHPGVASSDECPGAKVGGVVLPAGGYLPRIVLPGPLTVERPDGPAPDVSLGHDLPGKVPPSYH